MLDRAVLVDFHLAGVRIDADGHHRVGYAGHLAFNHAGAVLREHHLQVGLGVEQAGAAHIDVQAVGGVALPVGAEIRAADEQ